MAAGTFAAYAILENVERVLAGLAPSGLDALAAHGLLPIVVILVASLAVAAVVGLVRWRVRTLIARIRTTRPFGRHASVPRVRPTSVARPARCGTAATASRAPPILGAI
jgi:hypothetical protein